MPLTWYPNDFTKTPMTDMRMRSDPSTGYPGRTYRFYQGEKVYEFGYGLSYSHYSYKFVSINQSSIESKRRPAAAAHIPVSQIGDGSCEKAKISVVISVKNEGKMQGTHPVLLFLKHYSGDGVGNDRPMKQLVGFQTVSLMPNDKVQVEFEVNPCKHMSRATREGILVVDSGDHQLVVGDEEHPIYLNI